MKGCYWLSIVVVSTLLLGSCEESAGEEIVMKRQEPRTLLQQGTAVTAEESQRREKDNEQRQTIVEQAQRMLTLESRLAAARDAEAIAKALNGFARLGAVAKVYLDQLTPYLQHKEDFVRATALSSIAAIDPEAVGPYLERGLNDSEEEVRLAAVELWAKLRPKNLEAVVRLTKDESPRVQYAVLKVLKQGHPTAAVLVEIADGVFDLDGSVAKAALALVLPRRTEVKNFDEMIENLLDHADPTARLRTIDLMKRAKVLNARQAEKIVQVILEDPEESVRQGALKWLTALSPSPVPPIDARAEMAEREKARRAFEAFLVQLARDLP